MDDIRELLSSIKQTGYLHRRYTKVNTTSREWGYYVDLDANRDIEEVRSYMRLRSDLIEKLGLLEDIIDKVSVDQLMSLVSLKGD